MAEKNIRILRITTAEHITHTERQRIEAAQRYVDALVKRKIQEKIEKIARVSGKKKHNNKRKENGESKSKNNSIGGNAGMY